MNFKNCHLKNAKTDNLKDIQYLLEECGLPSHDISVKDIPHYFILKKEHVVIGTIGIELFHPYGLLRSLAIKEAYRKKGLGERLVSKLESYAVELNIRKLYLLTTTAESFFSKLNYKKTSREHAPKSIQNSEEFSNICPDSAVVMSKKLTKI